MKDINWQDLIKTCFIQDQKKYIRQLKRCKTDYDFAKLLDAITVSQAQVQNRAARVPPISIPENLPVSEKQTEIAETIKDHQVTIIAGETGSGKTTQIPKICLSIGLGVKGMIGHTQPRRIAARTICSRLQKELSQHTEKNIADELVAYQVRFQGGSNENTAIKLMTDGILLAEIKHDRYLTKYDTIIIDEAHERSLNIDFLLGYLKLLIKKRKDLKIIITSATIDVGKFSQHFNNAPIIEVSGRTYPVEVFYDAIEKDEDEAKKIVDTLESIFSLEKGSQAERRDILVFCSGEREIRQASTAIRKAQLKVSTIPLYSRLSLAEQNKAFSPSPLRKVILATNVAETSITVPNIGYVIDTGRARISRYSHRSKIQRLPIEAISQASAKQRMGRCGRVSDGICIRLYDEEDFLKRAEFAEAEILRSNLAAVILKMIDCGLGDIRDFPFIDKPDERLIQDGYKLLEELQAITPSGKLSKIGKQISKLPIDPRYGRILIAANEFNCLAPISIIISALSIQDPREYPAEKRDLANEKHALYADKKSDFISFLNLWALLEENRQAFSNKQFKQWCIENYISFIRVLEWRDIHRQLLQHCQQLKWPIDKGYSANQEVSRYQFENIHRALISGLLSHIASIDYKKAYMACRNREVNIFPASNLFKKQPKWFVANAFIETNKIYAHCIASILPEWVVKSAEHLIKKHYFEPYYDNNSGLVNAFEKVSLYGLTLIEKKQVYFGKIEPATSRAIFIREGLVAGKYQTPGRENAQFYQHNQTLIAEIENIAAKQRQRNDLLDDQVLIDFYEQRLPEKIINLASFERWRRQTEKDNHQLLFLDRDHYLIKANKINQAGFPDELDMLIFKAPVRYQFNLGADDDGVSLQLPLALLADCPGYIGDWLVPGLLIDKCIALIKTLPKDLRRECIPIHETVSNIYAQLERGNIPLHRRLAKLLQDQCNITIEEHNWQFEKLDDYYQLNYQLLNDQGDIVSQHRDLATLKKQFAAKRINIKTTDPLEKFRRTQLTHWDMNDIPRKVSYEKQHVIVDSYPYLSDEYDHVNIDTSPNQQDASFAHQQGFLRLLSCHLYQQSKYLRKEILNINKNSKLLNFTTKLDKEIFGSFDQLKDQIQLGALAHCFRGADIDYYKEQGFTQAVTLAKEFWIGCAFDYEKCVTQIIENFFLLNDILGNEKYHAIENTLEDISYQVEHLFAEDFLLFTAFDDLQRYPIYLAAITQRLEKALTYSDKDNAMIDEINKTTVGYYQVLSEHGYAKSYFLYPELKNYRHLLEEWRVSLFAQQLKTARPVSKKRLEALWQEISQSITILY